MNQELDIKACKRLLREIADLCEHATLTGALSDGARRTALRYNAVLAQLTSAGAVAKDLFTALPESASFGEVGAEARMLAGFLPGNGRSDSEHGDDPQRSERSVLIRLAPFIGQAELADLVRDRASKGVPFDTGTLTSLAPFLGQEFLSKLVRETLLKPDREPVQPAAPAAHSAPSAPVDLTPEAVEPEDKGVSHLLDMLQNPTLPEREREMIIERIRIATGG